MQVYTLCATYEEGDDNFKNVFPEVEENGGLAWFDNEEEEEN